MNAKTTDKTPSKGVTQPESEKADDAAANDKPLIDGAKGQEIGAKLGKGDVSMENLMDDVAHETALYLGPDPSYDVFMAAGEHFARGYIEGAGVDKHGVPRRNKETALKRWGAIIAKIEASGWEFKRPSKPTVAAVVKSAERQKNAADADALIKAAGVAIPPVKGDDADPVALRKAADALKKTMRGTKAAPVAKGVASEIQTRATQLENAARRAIETQQRKDRQVLVQTIIDACKVIPLHDVRRLAKEAQTMLEDFEALQEQDKPDVVEQVNGADGVAEPTQAAA